MSRVPVISSPCPFRWSSMPTPGQDFCGQCQRQVHNLDLMSSEQRTEFMQNCSGEVCVTYTVRRTPSLKNMAMGLGLAASLASGGVSAQDATSDVKVISSNLVQSVNEWNKVEAIEIESVVLVGGTILDADTARWVDESEIETSDLPELPQSTELQWLKTPIK
ncbi:MAG: hypothetical protein ACREO1_05995 [Arenimonas sp.]